ncbi:MAG: FMN-binding glutamate synthase family protein [Firmicutes bacterium]|nr:FMN-binding glutamate synthase family protein [Bacillota bacterium]
MSFVRNNDSAFNDSKTRSQKISPSSGMCSFCTEDCIGTCEIGLSAVLGKAMVYPTNTGNNQVAGEKDNPIDYSIFNINGRCFGALGAPENGDYPSIYNVKTGRVIGKRNPVKIAVPFTLPALIKLNWKDYFAAAAMAGTICVIGEGAPSKDPDMKMENGKIVRFEMLKEMLGAFNRYDRGYGQIVLQCNCEDDAMGLPEYAIRECGAKGIEFKFGQSAKGTQPANRLGSLEAAIAKKRSGSIVYPDPDDPAVAEAARRGAAPKFWSYARLPMWTEETMGKRIEELRAMGLKNVYFKTAGFDRADMERILRMASEFEVDMVTFDGAGGGSGYSPDKMMNEFGLPAACIESAIVPMCDKLKAEGKYIPSIVITGGFSAEDQAYKALALGAPYVTAVGLCRATMAAAMVGKKIGELLKEGNVPAHLQKFGSTADDLFLELGEVRSLYGEEAEGMSLGAVGAYSYLRKMTFGVQHFAALNRKFDVALADRSDLIPLTQDARMLLKGTWFDW